MAATTLDRNTKKRLIERQIVLTLAASTTIPLGVMVATNAAGLAVNASDTAALVVQGISCQAASTALGDTKIVVERGVFNMGNDGNVVAASVGTLLTVLDNQTVSTAATTTNDIGAGYCEEIDADGVWVSMLGGKVAAA
jgi:metal-dependent amidase/aminoacylase/carboxypeptidase family protein